MYVKSGLTSEMTVHHYFRTVTKSPEKPQVCPGIDQYMYMYNVIEPSAS